MALTSRTITGTLKDAKGTLLKGKTLRFKPAGVFGGGGVSVPSDEVSIVSDAGNATFSIDLLTSDVSGEYVRYTATFPDGDKKRFDLAAGSATTLDVLINLFDGTSGASNTQLLTDLQTDVTALQTADAANVKLTGNQSVAGVKTFASSPIGPDPTTDQQLATKAYVDANAGITAAPNGYAIRISQSADPYGRGGNNINCGGFWDADDDTLGASAIEAWTMPLNTAEYWFSDGQGGKHAWLIGWDGAASGSLGVSGNIWNHLGGGGAGAVESFASIDKVPPSTLHHVMAVFDLSYIYVFLDGVLTHKHAYSGPRGSGDGVAYWGGSDHSNFKGWIFRGRIWENGLPFSGSVPANYFAPEHRFRGSFQAAGSVYTIAPSLNIDFTTPMSVIPDTSSGFGGHTHPGVPSVGGNYALFTEPHIRDNASGLPTFEVKPFEQTAYAGSAPSTTPVGAILFDEFRRQDITPAWYDSTNRPANTAPTGQSWNTDTGLICEKAFIWANGIGSKALIDATSAHLDITFTNGHPSDNYSDRMDYIFRANASGSEGLRVVISNNLGAYDLIIDGYGSLAGVHATAVGALTTWQHTTLRVVATGLSADIYVDGVLKMSGGSIPLSTDTYVGAFMPPLSRLDKVEAYATTYTPPPADTPVFLGDGLTFNGDTLTYAP